MAALVLASSSGERVKIFVLRGVGLLFPEPIRYIVDTFWQLVNAAVGLPTVLQPLLRLDCNTFETCRDNLLIWASASWGVFQGTLFTILNLSSFPIVDTIIFTAMWVMLMNITTNQRFNHYILATTMSIAHGVGDFLRTISGKTWSNIRFSCVVLIGAYLSLSSIIAIPSLQEPDSNDNLTSDELNKKLQSYTESPTDSNTRIPSIKSIQTPLQLIDVSSKDTNEKEGKVGDKVDLVMSPILQNFNDQLKLANGSFNKMHDKFFYEQSQIMELATETYVQQNKGRKGVRETEQHALNIEVWYHNWWERSLQQQERCSSEVDAFAQTINYAFITLRLVE
jgi:hypothetical protein